MASRPLLPSLDDDSGKKSRSPRTPGGIVRAIRIYLVNKPWKKQLAIACGIITLLFIIIWQTFSTCILFPSIYFKIYPTPTSSEPTTGAMPQAWMDPRERALIENTLTTLREKGSALHPLRMLEYGSGYSTFHFAQFVDEYFSIEHDLKYCDGLFDMASHAGLMDEDIEIWRLDRDESGALISSRWDLRRAAPAKHPRVQIFCVPPSVDLPRTEESSWFNSWRCCFTRCPSTFGNFEDYLRVPSWIEELRAGQDLPRTATDRLITSKHTPRFDGKYKSANNLFPFPSLTSSGSAATHRTLRFDFALVDGRARPQAAWFIWPLLNDQSRIAVHDWNKRLPYHEVEQIYEPVEQQIESEQPGGGGVVILKRRLDSNGALKTMPHWWLGGPDAGKEE